VLAEVATIGAAGSAGPDEQALIVTSRLAAGGARVHRSSVAPTPHGQGVHRLFFPSEGRPAEAAGLPRRSDHCAGRGGGGGGGGNRSTRMGKGPHSALSFFRASSYSRLAFSRSAEGSVHTSTLFGGVGSGRRTGSRFLRCADRRRFLPIPLPQTAATTIAPAPPSAPHQRPGAVPAGALIFPAQVAPRLSSCEGGSYEEFQSPVLVNVA
jgi:hypothetical protein